MDTNIEIPKLSLVVLVGVSGSGKSSFAARHFKPTEILSSDQCRALVSDDQNNQQVTTQAFEILHFIAAKRLEAGKLTVVDATNVQYEARKPLVELARRYHAIPVAIVLDLPERICQDRNIARPDRSFGSYVIRQQRSQLRRSLRSMKREGFRHVWKIISEEEANTATVQRVPLWNDKSGLHGPFDIIGDIHGCYDELIELLGRIGYIVSEQNEEAPMAGPVFSHPKGRIAVFLGDFVDRGPRILDTIRLLYNMVQAGSALCIPGNHDIKLRKKLSGRDVQITHGLAESLQEIDALPQEEREAFREKAGSFIDGLVSHYVLDDGRLVVAHAGLKQEMQGRGSSRVRQFCLYGESTGETDEFGLPVRYNWAAGYRGPATVVYGHTPVPEPEWLNRTINIDSGCVFGGKLTALRYPEKELVCVQARDVYCTPVRPLKPTSEIDPGLTVQQRHDDMLDAEDVLGKRYITTGLHSRVTIREEQATAALEVISRFAVNPKWLIYLPPTMAPTETSKQDGFLERPEEGFTYFRARGIPRVVCEEKHMGSRAVVIVCRNEDAAEKHFGVQDEGVGIVYTRTGRRFFNDLELEKELLKRIAAALSEAEFWDSLTTDWVCLDCELMPWSEKAQGLLESQYAAVGAAASVSLDSAVQAVMKTAERSDLETNFELPPDSSTRELDLPRLAEKIKRRKNNVVGYIKSYRQYCWPVHSLRDLKLAPFHVLTTQGKVHTDKSHEWHMQTIAEICSRDKELLLATAHRTIEVTDDSSLKAGSDWWESLTSDGGEGMVIKPFDFVARGNKGLVQPAVKCRGREYLRIIYGPEYTAEGNIERLRARALGTKRSLALREFALGVEGLERFVRREPLRRIHECVFGVLALESEPVDPRL